MNPEYFMQEAIKEARYAESLGEVPIGCVIVHQGEIIARGSNRRELEQNPVQHAEMIAIQAAAKRLGSWRLIDCELYVTLEPCPMCAGAILLSRVKRVYFGTRDPKAGCAGSLMNLLQDHRFNHQTEVVESILEEECSQLLTSFFRELRRRKKEEKRRNREWQES